MLLWTLVAGVVALLCAVADLLHGGHHGDIHQQMLHVPEFVSFFAFLCVLEAWAFRGANRFLEPIAG